MQDGNSQTRRATKPKEPDSLSRLDSRNSQAAKADDTGAQQRSNVCVIQARRQPKYEVCACENILGVATIHHITGENRLVAEILKAVMAVPAIAIDAAHPGNADARSHWQLWGRAFNYFSHDLMAGN
jgi:hypothetical protein